MWNDQSEIMIGGTVFPNFSGMCNTRVTQLRRYFSFWNICASVLTIIMSDQVTDLSYHETGSIRILLNFKPSYLRGGRCQKLCFDMDFNASSSPISAYFLPPTHKKQAFVPIHSNGVNRNTFWLHNMDFMITSKQLYSIFLWSLLVKYTQLVWVIRLS